MRKETSGSLGKDGKERGRIRTNWSRIRSRRTLTTTTTKHFHHVRREKLHHHRIFFPFSPLDCPLPFSILLVRFVSIRGGWESKRERERERKETTWNVVEDE